LNHSSRREPHRLAATFLFFSLHAMIVKSGFSAALLLGSIIVVVWFWSGHTISPAQPVAISSSTEGVESKTILAVREVSVLEVFPQPAATASDEELLAMARRFVARSPQQVLAWAQAQADAQLRERMMFAALRAWGETDPCSGVNWALAQDDSAREVDMRAVLRGAASQPETAMQLARQLLANDSDTGGAYAAMLAGAFCADGKFADALRFVNGTPSGVLTDSVNVIFNSWAQSHPQDALDAVKDIADPQSQAAAFHEAVTTWKANDPAGLATYAAALPAGENRNYALSQAMDNWSLQDPEGLANWLNTLPLGGEFDTGTAMMLTRTDGANRPPDVAMQWVENINDPALRQNSLLRVVGEWNQSDPAAARKYVTSADWLDDQQRQTILQSLTTKPGN
jgi:hypothetical protein